MAHNRPTDGLIGIDVGGTKIAGGLLTGDRRPVPGTTRVIPTQAERGGQSVMDDALRLGRSLAESAAVEGLRVSAIGVGVPELVTPRGEIISAYHFDWRDLPVRDRLCAIAPAVIEADVRAAALAEAFLGAGRAYSHFAYLSLGTGISYTLVINGVPYPGAHGAALILASGALTHHCPICGHAHRFVLEDHASGPALARRYAEAAGLTIRRAEQVFDAAEAGDLRAAEILRSGGEALGVSVAFMINLVDPQAVIVGGGLGSAGGPYWDSFVTTLRDHIWSPPLRDLPVERAALKQDAGWIGAGLTAFRQRAGPLG
jgi:glucokinase